MKAILEISADPFTLAELDLVKRAANLCKPLIIALHNNPNAETCLSLTQRLELVRQTIVEEMDFLAGTNIKVVSFQGLLVEYAAQIEANVIIRSLRFTSDLGPELNLAANNKRLAPAIESLFLPISTDLSPIDGQMLKEIARYGGDIHRFVPKTVAKKIGNYSDLTKKDREL